MLLQVHQYIKKILGWKPPPMECKTCEEICHESGGEFLIFKEREIQNNNFEKVINIKLKKIFQEKYSRTYYEKPFLAHIPNGMVYGNGSVLSPDGRSLARDVCPDFGKGQNSHWLLDSKILLKPPQKLDGNTLVVVHNVSNCYYHWLFEEVPRLLFHMQREFKWILVSGSLPVQAEFVEILKNNLYCRKKENTKIIQVKGYETYKCKNLYIPSMPDRCFNEEFYDENRPSRQTILKIRDFVSRIPLQKDIRKVEKIFISRKNAASRKLHNEAQIEAGLSAIGFSLVELETMNLSEQIQLFQSAKCIIAAHGSGLSNLVFCGEGTRVIEIFPNDYIKPMYAFIAMHLNLDYRPIISERNIDLDGNTIFQLSVQSILDTLK